MSVMFTEIGSGVVTFVVWALVSVTLLSFIEYFVHRAFLHRGVLSSVLYKWLPSVDEYSRAHAVLHHTRYYRLFNFEPDPIGREIDLRLGLYTAIRLYMVASPLVLVLVLIAPAGAVIFSTLGFVHMYLWGLLHHEMHVPSNRFINGLAQYRFFGSAPLSTPPLPPLQLQRSHSARRRPNGNIGTAEALRYTGDASFGIPPSTPFADA